MAVDTLSESLQYFHSVHSRALGLALSSFGGFLIVLGNALAQKTTAKENTQLTAVSLLLIRIVLQLPVVICLLCVQRISIRQFTLWQQSTLLLMGVFNLVDILTQYLALESIPVADYTVALLTKPLLTYLIGSLVMQEDVSIADCICGIASCAGVLIMCQPSFLFDSASQSKIPSQLNSTDTFHEGSLFPPAGSRSYMIGIGFSVISSLAGALYSLTTKWCGSKHDVLLTVFYPNAVGMVLVPFLLLAKAEPIPYMDLSMTTWVYVIWLSAAGLFANMFIAEALTLENATQCMVMRNGDIVYGFFLQIVIINEIPSWSVLVGAVVVVISTTIFVWFRQ